MSGHEEDKKSVGGPGATVCLITSMFKIRNAKTWTLNYFLSYSAANNYPCVYQHFFVFSTQKKIINIRNIIIFCKISEKKNKKKQININ